MPEFEPPDANAPSTGSDGKAKKDKVRSVWISFIGRIVAQIIGAVASVLLGLFILQRYQDRPAPAPEAQSVPAPQRSPGQQVIAVLPLDSHSPDPADAYFAAGMTEVLISDLAQIEGWKVVSRTSTAAYRDTTKSVAQIGAELSADLLVEGSVLKTSERVRVVIQLIETKSDVHLFARTYDRRLSEVLTLQSDLAREIARSLKASIGEQHAQRLELRAGFDPAVYDLYLRGRQAWNQRTPEALSRAVDLFTEASRREPAFALPHVGLADAYMMGGSPSSGPADGAERRALARKSAERAMALSAHMAESHTALAGVQFFGDRDLGAAERSFKRAIELNPNYPVAHEWYALLLAELGRHSEARDQIDQAVALDPTEATMHQARAQVLYYGRQPREAVSSARRALEIRPMLPLAKTLLIKTLMASGDVSAAVSECGDLTSAVSPPDLLAACAVGFRRAGDGRASVTAGRLESRQPRPLGALLQMYSGSGDIDRAVQLLTSMQAAGNVPGNLAFEPLLDGLRADPRVTALMNR